MPITVAGSYPLPKSVNKILSNARFKPITETVAIKLWFRLIAIIALVVHTKGSVVQKSMDGMQHSLLQRMLQTGQRAKGICKVKNSAIMQSLGMA